MRFLIQRVTSAKVDVDGKTVGSIDHGFLVFIGVCNTDTKEIADGMVKKLLGLRIFRDENGKTNLSLADVGGSLLLISQFTLYADCRKGNRPSFVGAAAPDLASPLVDRFVELLKEQGVPTQTGVFGAHMDVDLLNSGPVTIILEY